MSRFKSFRVSTEAAEYQKIMENTYSPEEEAVVVQDMNEDSQEIEATLSGIEELQDRVDAVEDKVEVLTSVDPEVEPSEVEASLVENSAAHALDGIVDEEEISEVVTTESGKYRRLALEGMLMDTVKKIWKAIKEAVNYVWEVITKWYDKFFGMVATLKRKTKSLQERIEKLKGSPDKGDFSVTSGIKNLTVCTIGSDIKVEICNDGSKLINGLKNTKETVKGSVEIARKLEKAVKSHKTFLDGLYDEIERSVDGGSEPNFKEKGDMFVKLAFSSDATQTNAVPEGYKKDEKDIYYFGAASSILGGESLILVEDRAPETKDFTDMADYAAQIVKSASRSVLTFASKAKHDAEKSIDFKTLSKGDMENIINQVDGIADALSDFKSKGVTKSLNKFNEGMDEAEKKAARVVSRVESLKDRKSKDSEDEAAYKRAAALLKIARAISESYSVPTRNAKVITKDLLERGYQASLTALNMVSRSMSDYKVEK